MKQWILVQSISLKIFFVLKQNLFQNKRFKDVLSLIVNLCHVYTSTICLQSYCGMDFIVFCLYNNVFWSSVWPIHLEFKKMIQNKGSDWFLRLKPYLFPNKRHKGTHKQSSKWKFEFTSSNQILEFILAIYLNKN